MGLAVITGGSRGLGAALCDEYRRRGWSVLEFSRSAPFPFSVRVDLADTEDAADVFRQAFAELADHDVAEVVAISNAGVLGPVGPVARSSAEDVAANIDTNITAGVLFARAFVGAFQHHDCPKTFVNITSGAATRPYAGWSLYSASKAAMEAFVRAVALEQSTQPHPISAISVHPGVMDTSMQALARGSSVEDFPAVGRFLRLKEAGELVAPSDVAIRLADLVASRPESGGTYSARQP